MKGAAAGHQREATGHETKNPEGRWRSSTDEEITARDKASLDLFWLRDESLEDSANLPDPHVLAEEIADDLRFALEQIEGVLADLQERAEGLGEGSPGTEPSSPESRHIETPSPVFPSAHEPQARRLRSQRGALHATPFCGSSFGARAAGETPALPAAACAPTGCL